MFCQNCGKQIDDGSKFCPNCGNSVSNNASSQQGDNPIQQEKIDKKNRKWILPTIIVVIVVAVVAGFLLLGSSSGEIEKLITLVQNGYLGNYDTVSVKEILEYVYADGEWNGGEAVNGEHYIVEYKGQNGGIQFSIDGADNETFTVSGIRADGLDVTGMEAYDIKQYIDSLYALYARNFPEKGLNIDTSTSNNTMVGHTDSVKTVDESEYAVKYLALQVKEDLSYYADYTEEKLIAELGYQKNEFGIYPEDVHMNFVFENGKMYMIMLSASYSEDVGVPLFGVTLYDSVEQAENVLKHKEFSLDSTSETISGYTSLYIEKETGYYLSISFDKEGIINSISYMLENMQNFEEDETVDNSTEEFEDNASDNDRNLTPISITDGSYLYDDGYSCICNAEVGYDPERGGDYIYIECWGYGDHELIDFQGVLEENDDRSYYAYYDIYDASITVTFIEGGLYIQVHEANNTDMYNLEGYYLLEAQ